MSNLSHVNSAGESIMVEVSAKKETLRVAVAEASIIMNAETWTHISLGNGPKGEVLAVARVAAVMACKKTSDVIPMCHPLEITGVSVDFMHGITENGKIKLNISVVARNIGRTGIEMEVLYAANVAALTIYDMVKAIDKDMVIEGNRLVFKTGGRSGTFCRLPWTSRPRIVSVNVSQAKGERKIPVFEKELVVEHGIKDDGHAGNWHRQVSLLAMESITKMAAKGLKLEPGNFAENITTVGLDLTSLSVGSRISLGESVLEISQIGKECHSRCAIFQQAGDCVMPKEGIFAKVIVGGLIRIGDTILVH